MPASTALHRPIDQRHDTLRQIIRSQSLLSGKTFTLASGQQTQYFFDMKKTMLHPQGVSLAADILFEMIKDDLDIEYIGGLEVGAIPMVTAIAMRSWPDRPVHAFFVRKAAKDHGTSKLIDGQYQAGRPVILFEDVTTTGGSVMKAVHAVREQGSAIKRIITIVDRLEGATENLRAEGLVLDHVFTVNDFSD
jgi:orotate phosphoribosyltransferase